MINGSYVICYVVLSLYMVMSLLFMLSILYVRNTYISIHYAVKHMGGKLYGELCGVMLGT